jgi:hypothetical protein
MLAGRIPLLNDFGSIRPATRVRLAREEKRRAAYPLAPRGGANRVAAGGLLSPVSDSIS